MEKLKKEIRNIHIKKRKNMTFFEKEEKDKKIFKRLIDLEIFRDAKYILSYVSVNLEVDTINLIKYCFEKEKKVFVPVCSKKNYNMSFYFLNSLKQLHISDFSLLEPIPNKKNLFKNVLFEKVVSIVPGFVFSVLGDRIGYGKGFYDRFLKGFNGVKIGLCYDFNLEQEILKNSFDVPVDLVLTENRTINLI